MTDLSSARIVRSRRRSIGLRITEDAELVVHAPRWVTIEMIKKVVQEKERWIEKAKHRMLTRPQPPKRQFVSGEMLLFQGASFPIRHTPAQKDAVRFADAFFLRDVGADAHRAMHAWYLAQARAIIPERIALLAATWRIPYRSSRISSARSRWGSCSAKNSISITWRLILAPPAVLDYVICHELSHVIHKNHSALFWNHVEALMPDYQAHRRWLREHDYLLQFPEGM